MGNLGRATQALSSGADRPVETELDDFLALRIPLLSLPTRGGALDLTLTYRSSIWTDLPEGLVLAPYDDWGLLGIGWSLGFGRLVPLPEQDACFLLSPEGRVRSSRLDSATTGPDGVRTVTGHTVDGSFIRFTVSRREGLAGPVLDGTTRHPDGSTITYGAYRGPREAAVVTGDGFGPPAIGLYPVAWTDRHGNRTTVEYRGGVGPEISRIVDPLGREITFTYAGLWGGLSAISAPVPGGGSADVVRFSQVLAGNFPAPPRPTFPVFSPFWSFPMLSEVSFPRDGTGFAAPSYSPELLLTRLERFDEAGGARRTLETHDFAHEGIVAANAPPRLLSWTQNHLGAPAPQVTTFARESGPFGPRLRVTRPDGSVDVTDRVTAPSEAAGRPRFTWRYAGSELVEWISYTWEPGEWGTPFLRMRDDQRRAAGIYQTRRTRFTRGPVNRVATMTEELEPTGQQMVFEPVRIIEYGYEERVDHTRRHLLGLPTSRTVRRPDGTVVDRVEWRYDTAPLLDDLPTAIGGYDPAFRPGSPGFSAADLARGDRTEVRRFRDPADPGSVVVERAEFDVLGRCRRRLRPDAPVETSLWTADSPGPVRVTVGDEAGVHLSSTVAYDAGTGLPVETVDARGRRTTLTHRPLGELAGTATDGVVVERARAAADVGHELTTTTSLDGQVTHRVAVVVDPLGRVHRRRETRGDEEFTSAVRYDEWGRVAGTVALGPADEPEEELRYAHDEFHRPVSLRSDSAGAGVEWEVAYGEGAVPATVPAPRHTWYRTRRTVHLAGGQSWQLYDADERVVATLVTAVAGPVTDAAVAADPTARTTLYDRDDLGRVTAVSEIVAGTAVPRYAAVYDGLGAVVAEAHPQQRRTLDADGRWADADDPARWSVVHRFDAAGQLVSTVDACGVRTTHVREPGGLRRVTAVTRDVGPRDGAPHALAEAADVAVHHEDARFPDRPTRVTSGGLDTETWTYDDRGRAVRTTFHAAPHTAVTDDVLDGLDRVTTSTLTAGAGAALVTVLGYGVGGRVATVDVAGVGGVRGVRFDGADRFRDAEHLAADGRVLGVERFRSTPSVLEYTLGDVVVVSALCRVGADARPRVLTVTGVAGADVLDRSHEYDAAGWLAAVSVGPQRFAYGYDGPGRLTGATSTGAVGPLDPDVAVRAVDPGSGRLDGVTYDDAGRVVAFPRADGTVVTLRHDLAGRLVAADTDAGAGLRISYGHDWRRVATTDPTTATTHLWQGDRECARLVSGPAGAAAVRSVAVAGVCGFEVTEHGGATRVRRLVDLPFVGRVVGLSDAGTLTRAAYSPFGRPWGGDPPDPADPGARTKSGGVVDPGTGLVYSGHRWYSPDLGRFLGPDPRWSPTAGDAVEAPDAFCGNDPVGLSDPLGLQPGFGPSAQSEPDAEPLGGKPRPRQAGGGVTVVTEEEDKHEDKHEDDEEVEPKDTLQEIPEPPEPDEVRDPRPRWSRGRSEEADDGPAGRLVSLGQVLGRAALRDPSWAPRAVAPPAAPVDAVRAPAVAVTAVERAPVARRGLPPLPGPG